MSGCVPGENGTEEEEGEEGRWSLGDSIWDKRGKKRKKSSQERRRSFIHSSAASEESGREKKEIKKKRREDIVPYNLKEVAESPSTLSDDRRRSVRLALKNGLERLSVGVRLYFGYGRRVFHLRRRRRRRQRVWRRGERAGGNRVAQAGRQK